MVDVAHPETFDLDGIPVEHLGAELSRWMRAIDQAFTTAEPPDIVTGHVAALVSVMRLLQLLPGFDCELVTLRDLLARLEKLTVGQKQPIMTVVDAIKPTGRPPASLMDSMRESRAVALVQAAMSRGWTDSDARVLVANELARAGVRGRRGEEITARAVRTWSEKIKASDAVYRNAMRNFAEILPAQLTKSDMRKFVRDLIQRGESMRH